MDISRRGHGTRNGARGSLRRPGDKFAGWRKEKARPLPAGPVEREGTRKLASDLAVDQHAFGVAQIGLELKHRLDGPLPDDFARLPVDAAIDKGARRLVA